MGTIHPPIRFSIAQYDRMVEAGVFRDPAGQAESIPPEGEDQSRLELIDGEIVMMSPIGPRHEEIVDRLNAWSTRAVPLDMARVRIQQSLAIPGRSSVPQPDVAWVRPGDYSSRRPTAEESLLVIEVAETSLRFDLGEKADLYAAGGVPEYWVIDIDSQVVHVFREPRAGAYRLHQELPRGTILEPLGQAGVALPVEGLFDR